MPIDRTTVVDRRGGAGWIVAAVLIVALIVGIVLFTRMSGSETSKDDAVANAAHEVGNAAEQVGDAAKNASGPK